MADRSAYRFFTTTRVAFSDTDAQGIVYYGRYAPYFDLARIEYLRALDLPLFSDPLDTTASEFVMRHFEIDYHAPATFDDELTIHCRVAAIGRTSMTFEYEVVGPDERTLATSRQVMVAVDLDARRPVPVADELRTTVAEFEDLEA